MLMRATMRKVPFFSRYTVSAFWYTLLCIAILSFTSCGQGPETTLDTGSIAFSVKFQKTSGADAERHAQALDCASAGVSTVEAHIYDENDSEIAGGGPWDCEDHQGTVTGVPVGSNRKAVILGQDSSGNVIYRGETTGITVQGGQTTSTGTIIAECCIPTLLAPTDGESITVGGLSFEWSAIRVRLSIIFRFRPTRTLFLQ